MKKKKCIILLVGIIAIFVVVGVLIIILIKLDTAFLRKPNQAYENVDVIDGDNGISMKLSDKEKEELFEKFKHLELTRDFFHKPLTKWQYQIQFIIEGELYIITIVDDNYIVINENKFYKTEAGKLVDFIKEMLQAYLI